jgi:hypothetical protein
MLLASKTRIRTALLPPLLALCAVCLWPAPRARAESVTVDLIVYVVEAGAPNEVPKLIEGAQVSVDGAGAGIISGTTKRGRFISKNAQFDVDNHPSYNLTVKADGFGAKTIKITADRLDAAKGDIFPVIVVLTKAGEIPPGGNSDNTSNANTGNENRPADGQNLNGNASPSGVTPAQSKGLVVSVWEAGAWVLKDGVWWMGVLLVALVAGIIFAWRRFGFRPSLARPGLQELAPGHPARAGGAGAGNEGGGDGGQAEILRGLLLINKNLAEVGKKQNETYALVETLPARIKQSPVPGGSGNFKGERPPATTGSRLTPADEFSTSPGQAAAPQTTQPGSNVRQAAAPPPPQAGAVGAYHCLLGGRVGSIEPVYLNAENKSSLTDILEDGPVYLAEVGHTQGTFVLFDEGDNSGWVFPNPALMFREQALRPVFPSLTESEFNDRKDGITPRPASRISQGRWKLGGS